MLGHGFTEKLNLLNKTNQSELVHHRLVHRFPFLAIFCLSERRALFPFLSCCAAWCALRLLRRVVQCDVRRASCAVVCGRVAAAVVAVAAVLFVRKRLLVSFVLRRWNNFGPAIPPPSQSNGTATDAHSRTAHRTAQHSATTYSTATTRCARSSTGYERQRARCDCHCGRRSESDGSGASPVGSGCGSLAFAFAIAAAARAPVRVGSAAARARAQPLTGRQQRGQSPGHRDPRGGGGRRSGDRCGCVPPPRPRRRRRRRSPLRIRAAAQLPA